MEMKVMSKYLIGMKKVIYATISFLLMTVVILGTSGQLYPTLVAVVIGVLLFLSAKTKRGKKWWRTWCRVGLEFDLMFRNQVDNKNNKQQ